MVRGSTTPFLDIRSIVKSGGEQGLLSMAFDPNYATNHRFYVDYTDENGDTRVVRYLSNGTTANPPYGQAAALRQGLRPEPQRRPAAVRPRRPSLLEQRRRRRRGRPERERAEPEPAVRQDHATEREPGERALAAGRLRAAQSMAVLVRPRERRSLHRRRRSGPATRRSTTSRTDSAGSRTSGGSTSRASTSTTPARRCSLRGATSRRSSSTRTPSAARVSGGFVYRGKQIPAAAGRYFYGDYCSGTVWSLQRRERARDVRAPRAVQGARAVGLRRGHGRRALSHVGQLRRPLPPRRLARAAAAHLRALRPEGGVRDRLERVVQVAELVRDHRQLLTPLLAGVQPRELLDDAVEPSRAAPRAGGRSPRRAPCLVA